MSLSVPKREPRNKMLPSLHLQGYLSFAIFCDLRGTQFRVVIFAESTRRIVGRLGSFQFEP